MFAKNYSLMPPGPKKQARVGRRSLLGSPVWVFLSFLFAVFLVQKDAVLRDRR